MARNQIWNKGSRVSREVLFTRRSVMDGMRWAGTKMVCRISRSQGEIDSGELKHCPHCWDEVLKQVSNTRCPYCQGTGYELGYKEPFVLWCSIHENSPMDEKDEKPGIRDDQNVRLVLPCEPIFGDGDVFAEIRAECNGHVTEIGRIFQLDGPIERQTIQGWVSDDGHDGYRRTRVEDIIIAQRGTAKLLLPSSPVYEAGVDFWDCGCDCGCEVDGPTPDIPQGDQPTVDMDSIDPSFEQPYDWWN